MARKKEEVVEVAAESEEGSDHPLIPRPAARESRVGKLMESDLLKKILSKHGDAILTRGSDFKVKSVPRIPTGVFELDYALGGGFPAGRMNICYGHKSSGKTTALLLAIANAQKMCATCYEFPDPETDKCGCGEFREHVCAFMDVEGTWDEAWAVALGVDPSRVLLSVPDYAEQTLDIAEALMRSNDVDLVALDSIAFLTPAKEIEESSQKELQGQQARALGRGVRKFVAAINHCGNTTGRRPTLLFTNQIRMKIGVMFGNPETQPGGFAPGFAATTETKCWAGKYEMDETTGRPQSVELNFRVEKNKSSGAKMEGKYELLLADSPHKKKGQVYDEPAIVELGMKVGFVVKKSATQWDCMGETHRAKSLIVQKMLEDPHFNRTYRAALMKVLMA